MGIMDKIKGMFGKDSGAGETAAARAEKGSADRTDVSHDDKPGDDTQTTMGDTPKI